jgi:putative holin
MKSCTLMKRLCARANVCRMGLWLLISLALLIAVVIIAPNQLGVLTYKLLLTSAAAYVGFWLHRSAYPYARPGDLLDLIDHLNPDAAPPNEWELLLGRLATASMFCRAILMGSAMLAISMGL